MVDNIQSGSSELGSQYCCTAEGAGNSVLAHGTLHFDGGNVGKLPPRDLNKPRGALQ